jgi:anaerobic magnesium-protoporphyrin IX monomethyl ester cyclase
MLITASFEDEQRASEINIGNYSIGLGYLHSFIENKGHEVTTLFLNDYKYDDCIKISLDNIHSISPDIIGFQIFTVNRVSSFRLIEIIHDKYPEIKLIIGGIHTTVMYKQILESHPYLTAVLGEGELTFLELIENKKPIEHINGIAFNSNRQVIKTRERELIENLDILPFPKHEIFLDNGLRKCGCILTNRGCPFACSFCCLRAISQRKVRFRSIENVVDEIEYMTKTFKEMNSIWIHDDSFFLDKEMSIF